MASTPRFKVYTIHGEYLAATKYAEDAAVLVSSLGLGAYVRWMHTTTVWVEGSEEIPAGESYDRAATIMRDRIPRAKAA